MKQFAQMLGRVKVGIAATALALLAAPAVAQATTYCVSDPACVSAGGTSRPNLQAALDAAAASASPDRVEIGAGTFTAAGPSGFFYSGGTPGNHVDVVGDGPTKTILRAPDASDSNTSITLQVDSVPSAGDSSTVSDLKAVLAGATNCCPNSTGLSVTGAITRVVVTSKPAPNPTINAQGIWIDGTVSNSTVEIDKSLSGGGGIRVADGQQGTILDSNVTAYHGIYAASSGVAATSETVKRVSIDASYSGIYNFGGSVNAEDVVIDLDGGAYHGIYAAADPNNNASTVLRNGTILGGNNSATVESMFPGRTATISINSSILEGSTTSLFRSGSAGGTAQLSTRYSNYSPTVVSTGGGALTQGPGITAHADPGFVNAAGGDYHLRTGSPLLDLGDPAALLAGESTTDLDGNPRVVRGRRDVGAFELQLPCGGKPATIVRTAAGETIVGTPGADVIAALGGKDKVLAKGGNDIICAGGGRDRVIGGGGGDTLLGQGGPDALLGGAGRDRLLGGKGRDRLRGGKGRDRLRGGPGPDVQVQ